MALRLGFINGVFKTLHLLLKLANFIHIQTALIKLVFQPFGHFFPILSRRRFSLLNFAIQLGQTGVAIGDQLLPVEAVLGNRFALLILNIVAVQFKLALQFLLRLLVSLKLGFSALLTLLKRMLIFAQYRLFVLCGAFAGCFCAAYRVVLAGHCQLGHAHRFIALSQLGFTFVLFIQRIGQRRFGVSQCLF